jgi:UDP-glucuronate 4-epimerase
VTGLDNLHDYYPVRHKERNLRDLLPHPEFRFVQGDLRDAAGLAALCAEGRFHAVAHLAAMSAVRYSMAHPLLYGEVNVQGSLNLLEAARAAGTPPVILASTGSVYGADTPTPFAEEAPAARQLAPYPASKRAMELLAHPYHHLWGLPVTILRFFNVYGPHGRPDMMPWQWTERILTGRPLTLYEGGRLLRDWTYVDDVVEGFCAALARPQGYEILNLGGGRPVANLELVRTLESLLGREAMIEETAAPPSEPPVTFADTRRAAQVLGYRARVELRVGLERFVRWYLAEEGRGAGGPVAGMQAT